MMHSDNFIVTDKRTYESTVQNCLLKLAAQMRNSGRKMDVEIKNFMTWDEQNKGQIMRRNLKHFLSINANLSQFELSAFVGSFDLDNDGFIDIEAIKKREPQTHDIDNFLKSSK